MNILDQEEQIDPQKNYYDELVGDGKKFKDNEDLAKGKYMSDMHIRMLEKRMDELRADYLKAEADNQARAKLEDLIKTLENKQPVSSDPPNSERGSEPKLDLNDLDKLMSQKLEQGLSAYEQANRQKENTRQVVDRLKERYGENYSGVVKQQIQSLGMSEDLFNQMVKDSPTAVLKTLGIDETKENYQAPPKSSSTFQFKGPPKRTWSFYQDLKKTNPRLYHDPKTLIQMEKDALELGPAFEDGTFNS